MAEEYKERLTGNKISLFNPNYIVYKFLIKDLEFAIKKFSSGRLLDVGCGNKPYKEMFPKTVTEYIGCDIEQSNLKLVDIICPATDLAFDDQSFDTVFCTQVLEHVFDHKKAFFEISRVLKPGGVFIGSLPMTWQHHEEPYDFFRFTKYGIERLISEAGLEIEYIRANGGKWALLGQMIITNFSDKPNNSELLSKFKNLIFRLLLMKVWINLIFSQLDKISSHPEYYHTLNFVFVAKKASDQSNKANQTTL